MKTYIIFIFIFYSVGCSHPHPNMIPYEKEDGTKNYDKPVFTDTLMAMPIYHVSYENQAYTRCHKQGFCVKLPRLYKKDYQKPSKGWNMMSSSNGFVVNIELLNGWISYDVDITTYKDKVGEHQRAVMRRDVGWYRRKFPMREYQKNEIGAIDLHFETKGKEGYPCVVSDYINTKRGIKGKVYNCYKFNPNKTKYTKVQIELIYNKAPNLPKKYKHLAKQYTYADLKRRAKRMLDSLYIKDGW